MAHDPSCVFCKIAKGEIPSKKIYEDEALFAIEDLHPKAPIHLLFIPKDHIVSLTHLKDTQIMARLFEAIGRVARDKGFDAKGFRTVINTGPEGGQTVFHLHLHILAGKKMGHDF